MNPSKVVVLLAALRARGGSVAARLLDWKDTEVGASLVEYTLLLSLIVLVAVGALSLLGEVVKHSINNSAHKMFP